MKALKQQILYIASFLLVVGCADDSVHTVEPPEDKVPPLSKNFSVIGDAVGDDRELSIDCACNLVVELAEEPNSGLGAEYAGVCGGGLRRTLLSQDGSGISLMPDVSGEVIVRVVSADSIQLLFPANEGTGSRFWDNIALFKGARDGDSLWEGEWVCAPFDIYEGVGSIQWV